jgi:hypothetical protein
LQLRKKVAIAQKSCNCAKKFADFYVGIVQVSKKLQLRKKVAIAQKSCNCAKKLQMREKVAITFVRPNQLL